MAMLKPYLLCGLRFIEESADYYIAKRKQKIKMII